MRTIKEALVAIALEGHRWPKENKRATNTQFILDQLHVDCTKEILEHRKRQPRRTRVVKKCGAIGNPRCRSLLKDKLVGSTTFITQLAIETVMSYDTSATLVSSLLQHKNLEELKQIYVADGYEGLLQLERACVAVRWLQSL